jgi:hypothetical protein
MNNLLGQKVDLHRVDIYDPLRLPVSGEIVKNFYNSQNVDGFFLLKLDRPFEHEGIDSHHILFWSPLMHRKKNIADQVDALILLIPDMKLVKESHIDEDAFLPFDWAKACRRPNSIETSSYRLQ